ncbi:MAG: GFA family protein [Rhizomicrobium sp.]
MPAKRNRASDESAARANGRCLCGAVEIEIDIPAFWAWHDHGRASRLAHGAAYATYVGCWRRHVRIARGAKGIVRFEDKSTATTRSFCARCGSPLFYEKKRAPHAVNIPRALFAGRTGREPRYHLNFPEHQDWTWSGEKLVPLKAYPGVMFERPKTKKRVTPQEFE